MQFTLNPLSPNGTSISKWAAAKAVLKAEAALIAAAAESLTIESQGRWVDPQEHNSF